MPGAQHGERREIGFERGHRVAQGERQEVLRPTPPVRLRLGPRPLAQHALLVHRPRAEGAETVTTTRVDGGEGGPAV